MMSPTLAELRARQRSVLLFTQPAYWPLWPFLPVVRRHAAGAMDYGVVYDFASTNGPTGYRSTVFRTNLFALPRTLADFLALPREVFDTPEEMAAAGWVVD